MDSAKLAEALAFARDTHLPLHSVTVIRNGSLVLDASFYPYEPGVLHDVASVTKSVTSALIGIAIDKGYIRSVEQPVLDFFPGRTVPNLDATKRAITVEHLLTMRSGLDCGFAPGEAELFAMFQSRNWVQFTLGLPMKLAPGTRFVYCGPGVHLLTWILRKTTGKSPVDFARQHLFEPLGIQEVVWPADPQGVNTGWGNLRLHPHDMARLGYLYLHQGTWDGRQLLRPEWVSASTSPRVSVLPYGSGRAGSYGYLWWVGSDFYAATGRGGQVIAVHPEKHLVVVLTGGADSHQADRLFEPNGLLLGHLFPAAVLAQPLLANPAAQARLTSLVEAATRPPAPEAVAPLPEMAHRIAGKTYRLGNGLDWRTFALGFAPGEGWLAIDERVIGPRRRLAVGLDNVYRLSPGRFGMPTAARGAWKAEDAFGLEINELGMINDWRFTFTFRDDRVTVTVAEMTGLPSDVRVEGRIEGSLAPGVFLAHVAAGIIALCTAPAAILSCKGGVWHRRWGKIFFWTIAVLVVSALTLLIMRPNLLLLMIAIMVSHSAFAGYRALSHKRPDLRQKPNWLDWAAAVIAAVSGVVIVVVVFSQGGVGQGPMPAGALIVFLGIIAWMTGRHLLRFIRPAQNPNAWWFAHMGTMTDAFIVTVTAFSSTFVAPLTGVPVSWSWTFFVVPLVVGILAQRLWMHSYQRKFARGLHPADVATVRLHVASAEGHRP
jgi:CubicO group peptidase (beta-lactamase class C family)